MNPITSVAMKFFHACETGKGWEGCRQYCHPDATFAAQAEPLAEVRSLQHAYSGPTWPSIPESSWPLIPD